MVLIKVLSLVNLKFFLFKDELYIDLNGNIIVLKIIDNILIILDNELFYLILDG